MLSGKTIAITRSKEDSKEFIELMTQHDAVPITLPTIELVRRQNIVETFLEDAKEFDPDFSIFMSSKAVKLLFDSAKEQSQINELSLAIANTIVIAVGPKTRQALEREGIKVSYVPDRYSSVGVGEVLSGLSVVGKKAIVPRSGASTSFLRDLLKKIGMVVKENYLYDVKPHKETDEWRKFKSLFSENKIDGIIFTSASSVRAFMETMSKEYSSDEIRDNLQKTHVVAIGPFTATELEGYQIQNISSHVHTIPGAFETIQNIFSLA